MAWFGLPDGLRLGLRPIHPDDREALVEGFGAMSEYSRYHRFLTPMARLSPRQAEYLTALDQVNHFAWGAGVRDDTGGIRGIGVARYVRDGGEPDQAEIAVAVADAYQGRGIGTLLVQALAVVAQSHGIVHLVGYMLGANTPMIRIFERMGAALSGDAPGVLRADMPLRPELCGLDRPACRELVRIADRAAHPSAQHRDPPD